MNIEDLKYIRNQLGIGLEEAKSLLKDNTVESAVKAWKEKQKQLLKEEQNRKFIDFKDWFYIKDYFVECSEQFFNDKTTIPNQLQPLTENYSKKLWNQYISKKHRHLMLVKSDEDWNIENVQSFDEEWNWMESWNSDDYNSFEDNVKHRLDWNVNDEIFFFWGRYTSVKTTWKTLYMYWIPFLYEDELNIVLNLKSNKVLIIATNGGLAIGKRKKSI